MTTRKYVQVEIYYIDPYTRRAMKRSLQNALTREAAVQLGIDGCAEFKQPNAKPPYKDLVVQKYPVESIGHVFRIIEPIDDELDTITWYDINGQKLEMAMEEEPHNSLDKIADRMQQPSQIRIPLWAWFLVSLCIYLLWVVFT